jgi:pimeloyl-ACP methyl ester carboxylesterase
MKLNILLILGIAAILSSCEKIEVDSTNAHDVFYLRNNDADMPVHVKGNTASKTFLLWLHGGPGSSTFPQKYGDYPVMDLLEERYANVYWDQRCAGNSTGTFDPDNLSIDVMINDLEKLIVLIKSIYGQDIELILVGHSWGGTFGYAYLTDNMENQNQFAGYICIDGSHNTPLLLQQQKQEIIEMANRQIEFGKNTGDWANIINKINGIDENDVDNFNALNQVAFQAIEYLMEADSIDQEDWSWYSANNIFGTPDIEMAMISKNISVSSPLLDEIERFNVTDDLPNVQLPVLLISGKYDLAVTTSNVEDAFSLIGSVNKSHVVFERSAHSPYLSAPEQFTNEVDNFILNL